MSLPTAEQLTDYEYLRSILKSYHEALHEEKSFPPLSPDKAAHILAKTLGMKNGHVLKAEMAKLSGSATQIPTPKTADLYELEFKDCPVYSDTDPVSSVFRSRGEAIWHLYHHYVCDKLVSAIDNRLSMDFEDKLEEILSILRRHELDIRPALTWEVETDEDEADAVKALKMTLCEDVHQFWPLDAILELIDLHFDERDANEDIESWYMIRKIEPRTDDQGALKSDLQCPSRFKV